MKRKQANRIRVLHVDDEPNFGELVAMFLERERDDFEVVTVTSAQEALDYLSETTEAVDCIVSDYDMPGMDGLELLQVVREDDPNLPFILFTGRGSEEIASEAITAGVSEYLNKKSGTDQYTVLANRIDNLVAQYRAERNLMALDETIRAVMAAKTPAEVATIATTAANDILGLPMNAVHLHDAERGRFVPLALSSEARELFDEAPTIDETGTVAGQTLETGELQLYDDVRNAPRVANAETPIRSELVLPLGDHGVFTISSTTVGAIRETDVALARILAANVEVALDRLEDVAELAR